MTMQRRRIDDHSKVLLAGIALAAAGFGWQFGMGCGLGVSGTLLALCAAIDRPLKELDHGD